MNRTLLFSSTLLVALASLTACGGGEGTGGSGGSGGSGASGGGPPAAQDILSTDLVLDLGALSGVATIQVVPAAGAVHLEAGGLTVHEVTLGGSPATYEIVNGGIDVTVPQGSSPVTIGVQYDFTARPDTGFDGWMPGSGVTFLWPYFCGNLFPCVSEPADGSRFTMDVLGVGAGLKAVFPASIPADAPSYMPAVAVADFTEVDLGTTPQGTHLRAFHLPGQETVTAMGTAHLVSVFDFYETTYGAYTFGSEVGTVSANWGPSGYGGMEHHPFFHVGSADFANEETQAHEAAHGWFGDGVRIACWEDFVLSEGTVSYMAAHALEKVGGPSSWAGYVAWLTDICEGNDVNTIALPSTCNQIDLLNDDLWSGVPYMKGACFFEEVADAIGPDLLDTAIASFYQANVGKAASMRSFIEHIKSKAPVEKAAAIDAAVTDWLETLACPADYANRCGNHNN